jgi:hypothetical protein
MCYIRKNFLVCPEKHFETSPPLVANISGKKILDALFYSKSAPQSLAPPTFRSFLRPWCNVPHNRTLVFDRLWQPRTQGILLPISENGPILLNTLVLRELIINLSLHSRSTKIRIIPTYIE